MRNPFKRRKAKPAYVDDGGPIEGPPMMKPGTDPEAADYDPLDPHGDGTLRPGDPIFEAAMRGNAMVGTRNEDGTWEMRELADG